MGDNSKCLIVLTEIFCQGPNWNGKEIACFFLKIYNIYDFFLSGIHTV